MCQENYGNYFSQVVNVYRLTMLLIAYQGLTGSALIRSRYAAFYFNGSSYAIFNRFYELPQSNLLYGDYTGLKRGVIWDGSHWLIKFPQETTTIEKLDVS